LKGQTAFLFFSFLFFSFLPPEENNKKTVQQWGKIKAKSKRTLILGLGPWTVIP
jgi:hypothetical protein